MERGRNQAPAGVRPTKNRPHAAAWMKSACRSGGTEARRRAGEARPRGVLAASRRRDQAFSAPSSPCSNSCTGWPGMMVEIACL
jgi:hypothetical protein